MLHVRILRKKQNHQDHTGEIGGEVVLTPATTQVRWLALSLSMALAFIGLSSAIFGSAIRGAGTVVASPARDTNAESDEIELMIAKYAKSIDEADTTLASQIWPDSPEVSFIHPLGHEHGWEQIKQNVYRHLMGDTFSERKLSIHDISAHVYGDAAWAEFHWDFAAKYSKDGSPITTHGRETQVYRKEQGHWRLVHVHYSGMPVTEEQKSLCQTQM
jgi:ketosteroid isomerase-like protein